MSNAAFSPVSLAGHDDFYARWQATPQHSLDYTLANIWGWQQYFGLEWRFTEHLCWIRQTLPGPVPVYWAPIGDWSKADWDRELQDGPRRFIRVPEALMEQWRVAFGDCRLTVHEDRGQWEYLYKQEELLALSGNRFHKKKNLYSQFVKAYGTPDYRPLDDAMVEDVLALQDDWCQWHECEDSPSLRAENDAINREFARFAGENFQLLNRAQDLDEEGLRQAKMSYNPSDFLRKYIVEINLAQSA